MHKKQIEIVEFSEKVYHLGLRHKGINGSLYEDFFIQILRKELPHLDFYKGQLHGKSKSSSQYDIMICEKRTKQPDYLKEVNPLVNIVASENCYGVIELKKWANPKMIMPNGEIHTAFNKFKECYPSLKYIFVALRFKDRKNGFSNWNNLQSNLNIDYKFCFFGNTCVQDKEWLPWTKEMIEKHNSYDGEFERLVKTIIEISGPKL